MVIASVEAVFLYSKIDTVLNWNFPVVFYCKSKIQNLLQFIHFSVLIREGGTNRPFITYHHPSRTKRLRLPIEASTPKIFLHLTPHTPQITNMLSWTSCQPIYKVSNVLLIYVRPFHINHTGEWETFSTYCNYFTHFTKRNISFE